MPITSEKPTQDAPASLETQYCFVPNEDGSFNSASKNNTFTGSLSTKFDKDWIIIELQAGKEYTFTLRGDGTGNGTLEDPILMILDSKGGHISTHDDIDGEEGDLDSRLKIKPDEDGKFYLSVSAYTGNPGQTNAGNYTLTVVERLVGPADVKGTDAAEKLVGTGAGELIDAAGGNDVIDAGAGDDEIDAGDGNDLITGGPGADTIDGGKGTDTVSYKYSAEEPGPGEMITINLHGNLARGGDAEGDSLENIANVIGARYAENMLTGDRGDNRLEGGAFNDMLVGDRGEDTLLGGDGDDELDGGDGDDTLEGGPGADELTGGDGNDMASYAGSTMMGVTVRLHTSQAMGGHAEGDTWGDVVTVEYDNPDPEAEDEDKVLEETVPDIVNLTGSPKNDTLAGDSRHNDIWGGGGNDTIYGGPGGGDDNLWGQGGDDAIFGGIGVDVLDGGRGDDELLGGPGADTVYGGYGSDMIYADVGTDGSVIDTINGWVKDEDPDATGDQSTRAMEMAKDRLSVDTVSFEKVKKLDVTATLGTNITNVENMIGSDQDDALTGNGEDNVIDGGDGGDTLRGGDPAAGSLPTGSIGDTVTYARSDRGVTVDLSQTETGDRASGGHAQGDDIDGFENVTGSAHDDTLEGDTTVNILKGLAGDDEIVGRDGGDTIEGGAGADELDGDNARVTGQTRSADDTLSYEGSDAGVSVNLATVTVSGGHADGDEIVVERGVDHDNNAETDEVDVSTFEHVIGSMHNDRLTGDHRMNTLNGGDGDDTLRGNAEVDTLIGGPGADVLDGGSSLSVGADTETKDDDIQHIDIASYSGARAGVIVDLNARKGTGGDAMGDTYRNIERYDGSDNDDEFIASKDVDIINAGTHAMDNEAKGANAPDGDTISYEESETGVTINLASDQSADLSTAIASANADDGNNENFAEGDIITGFENVTGSEFKDMLTAVAEGSILEGLGGNDTLTGAAGSDTLMGGKGRDTLSGLGGADRLVGGAGDDIMTGGTGDKDVFVFSPRDGAGVDVIKDFEFDLTSTYDQIDLTAFGIQDVKDLVESISMHDSDVRIDLTGFGGGIIILEGAVTVDNLDTTQDNTTTDGINEAEDGVIQALSTGESGLFII